MSILKKIFLAVIILLIVQGLYFYIKYSLGENKKNAVDKLYDKGVKCCVDKQYNKAVEIFSEVIKQIPSDAKTTEWAALEERVYFCRGAAYYLLSEYNKAIPDFSCTIKLEPNNKEAYYFRGTVYFYLGEYEKALADFSHSIKSKLSDKKVFYYRGMTYCGLKQYDKAMEDFSKAPEVYTVWGRAYVYCRFRQYENAMKNYSTAIEVWQTANPEIISAYLGIMEVCIISSNPDKFNYWLKELEKNISFQDLEQEDKMIKLYLILVNKCIMNKPLENTEKELDQLLEDNKTIKANWSCELVDEWLKEPKNGLSSKQKKYIQALTDKIKVYSLKK